MGNASVDHSQKHVLRLIVSLKHFVCAVDKLNYDFFHILLVILSYLHLNVEALCDRVFRTGDIGLNFESLRLEHIVRHHEDIVYTQYLIIVTVVNSWS